MKKVKFDCNGRNAPAYSCDTLGDNSGYYYPADKVDELISAIRDVQEFMSSGFYDDAAERLDLAIDTVSA